MVGTRGDLANTNPSNGVNPNNTGGLDEQTKAFIQQLIDSAMTRIETSFQASFQEVLLQHDYLKVDVNRLKNGEGTSNGEHVDDVDKVKLASIHFFDSALIWHQQFEKLNGDSYHEKFELFLNKVDMPKAHAISLFLGECQNQYLCQNRGGYVALRNQETPLALPVPKSNTFNPTRKYLSQKEFDDKRAKGLCFHYDQKFVPGHKCSGQAFALELVIDPEPLRWKYFDNLENELQEARTQITKLQRKQMGNNHKIALARFRITNLEQIIEEIQDRHQADKKNLQDAIYELKNSQEGPSDY
ncbi:hypothetical protein Tco_0835747 [Tanacetum coccineum]